MTVSVSKQVTDFAEQAEAWTRAQAAANPDEDLWRAVGTVTTVVANTRNSLLYTVVQGSALTLLTLSTQSAQYTEGVLGALSIHLAPKQLLFFQVPRLSQVMNSVLCVWCQ